MPIEFWQSSHPGYEITTLKGHAIDLIRMILICMRSGKLEICDLEI